MTIGDLFCYLVLGAMLGVYSTLQSILQARFPGGGDPAPAVCRGSSDEALHAICRIERTADLDARVRALTELYEQIVAAFAQGDISRFADRMSTEVGAALAAAIAARPAPAAASGSQLVCVRAANVLDAALADGAVSLRISFIGLVAGREQDAVLRESADIWTFERSIERRRPQWRLVATEPAE